MRFVLEPQYVNIRPDAIIGFISNGVKRLALLEVELSNKGFNAEKYNKYWQKHFPVKPELIIISDHKTPEVDYKTNQNRFTI